MSFNFTQAIIIQFRSLTSKLLIIIGLSWLLIACNENIDKKVVDQVITNKLPSLTFSVHPYDNPSRLIERFQPLCTYLSKQLNREVKLVINRSYIDQIRQITQGNVDLSYMGPTPYLRAQDHYLKPEGKSLQLVAAEAQNNVLAYRSVIVTREKSNLKTIKQLQNHSMAFGAAHSFSSHYVPRFMLQSININLASLKDYAFLNSHEKVALAVLHGDFDAGGVRKKVADRYLKNNKGLRIIAESFPLPPHVIVARPKLNESLVVEVKEAFLNALKLDKKMLNNLGQGTTFLPITDDAFLKARQIVDAVENVSLKNTQISPAND